ncbi:MAG: class I SAM-dependent methyltransferase [Hyphomicrobiaceae bacterium]
MMKPEEAIQRARYARIADDYDTLHMDPEHAMALAMLSGMLDQIGVSSVLDVGAGTGRAMRALRKAHPQLKVVGVEPVAELRQAGHRMGIPENDLIEGNGYQLQFGDGAFDLVCESGILHHVRHPERVIAEMLRVARKAIFISDSNNFGGGSWPARLAKQTLNGLGLWPLTQWIVTGGKGYAITEGDGLFYSYSVFNDLALIERNTKSVHMMNTTASGPNLYRTASHVALLGLKR